MPLRAAPRGISKPLPWLIDPLQTAAPELWRGGTLMPAWERSGAPALIGTYPVRGTPTGSPRWGVGRLGPYVDGAANVSTEYLGTERILDVIRSRGQGATVTAVYTHTGAPSSNHATLYAWAINAFTYVLGLKRDITTDPERIEFVVNGINGVGNTLAQTANVDLATGQTYLLVGTWIPGQVSRLRAFDLDSGQLVAEGVGQGQPVVTLDSRAVTLNLGGFGGRYARGLVHTGGVWTHALASDAVDVLRADPFAMFRRRRVLVSVPSGPAGQTLAGSRASAPWSARTGAVQPGGATLTGSRAISAWAARAGATLPGTATLGGFRAAALWTAPAGALQPGGVTLTGARASAPWSARAGALAAGAVPQTLAGQRAAAVWAARTSQAEPGSVTLGGARAAALWAARTGSVLPGAVALAGARADALWAARTSTLLAGRLPLYLNLDLRLFPALGLATELRPALGLDLTLEPES